MAKPPVVHAAGLLRGRGLGITTDGWLWMCNNAGQLVGEPPSIAGWNDLAWLNTASHAARWTMATQVLRWKLAVTADYAGKTETPAQAIDTALAYWGQPLVSAGTLAALQNVASQTWAPRTPGDQYGSLEQFLTQRQNALRVLCAVSPDFQTC